MNDKEKNDLRQVLSDWKEQSEIMEELIRHLAQQKRWYYDELIQQGFEPDEALELCKVGPLQI